MGALRCVLRVPPGGKGAAAQVSVVSLIQWMCNMCHSRSHWFIFESKYRKFKTCRACTNLCPSLIRGVGGDELPTSLRQAHHSIRRLTYLQRETGKGEKGEKGEKGAPRVPRGVCVCVCLRKFRRGA